MELFLVTFAYILGIILGLYFKLGIVLLLFIIFIFIAIREKNKYFKLIFKKKYLILFIIVLLISAVKTLSLEKSFNEKYKDINGLTKIEGTIISNPKQKQYKSEYVLKVENINSDFYYKNTKVLVYIKNNKNQKVYKYGDKISFTGEFEFAQERRNTGGFDYRQYLKTKGIYGIVNTTDNNIEVNKENNINLILISINNLSIEIKNKINEIFSQKEGSILQAILIGSKDNMEDDIAEAFRKSNLSHMLAVSGLHTSYVVMGAAFLISKFKIGKNKGKILTIIILLFFMNLTGTTLSVARACIMSIYMIVVSLLKKRINIFLSINFSILVLTILNPYCIFDIGLQLSFGGTLGIVLLYKFIKDLIGSNKNVQNNETNKKEKNRILKLFKNLKIKIQEIILVSISANIMIMPIMLYHFNTISLTFIISNLLATPIIGILLIMGFMTIIISFIFMPVAKILSIPLNQCLRLFLWIATSISYLPFSTIYMPKPKLIFVTLYYIIILTVLYSIKIKRKSKKRRFEKKFISLFKFFTFKRLISIILILALITTLINQTPQNLKIYFIDVGQGDSTLIVSPQGKNILIDGGGSSSYDVGKNILLPYLLGRGILKIDYIIVSHFDTDHVRTEFLA